MAGVRATGEGLREARERAGLTVEEASRRTRIPQRYLEALESGDLSLFPKGPFLSGYTKQYRAFLQLPDVPLSPGDSSVRSDLTLPRASASGGGASGTGVPGARGRDSSPSAAPRPSETRRGTFFGGPTPGPGPRSNLDPATVPEATATGPAVPGSRTRRRATRLAAMGATITVVLLLGVQVGRQLWPSDEASVGVAPDQRINVAVVEPRRARVDVDGRRTLDGWIKPGGARTFEGHDRISLELETLEGVTVSFDGRTLTPLGARSRPRRLVFIDDAGL